MKIVIFKTEGYIPHTVTQEHIEKIKNVDSSLEVIAVSASENSETEPHLADAEVVAGIPQALPDSFKNAKNLKWIQSFSAGVDKVLASDIKERDVLLSNIAGAQDTPIAEHILGFLLLFTKKFHVSFRNQAKKIWERDVGATELRGKVVLIAGLGNIGTEAARLASCVGARVVAVDRPGAAKPDFVEKLYGSDEWEQALPTADFVVSCVPHTEHTHYLFNKEKFAIIKHTAVFVNISRGEVVREADLIEALKEGIIAGAALDVMEQEPLPKDSPLWEMENVVVTPHRAGHSEKYMDRAVEVFCKNLQAYIKGETLPNLVDKQKGY